MERKWLFSNSGFVILKLVSLLCCLSLVKSCATEATNTKSEDSLDSQLKFYVDRVLSVDDYYIAPGISVGKLQDQNVSTIPNETCTESRSMDTIQEYVHKELDRYTQTHVLSINVPQTARFFKVETGKSSFMTGFGMGFLAFALKKLLLPFFIGAQLVKSVLIAMFLPSILGSVGKLVGKGLSTFSGVSGASAGINNNNNHVEDFEFKDTEPYNNEAGLQDFNSEADTISLNVDMSTVAPIKANSRFGIGNQRISYVSKPTDNNYYMRRPNKKTDYKIFHKIPSSSMLLTSYDPFYSPLLSRLDALFQQLGLGNDKSTKTERCRERLVCMMYANPAKYAPYSNLVSAQLSRELNELRKPASDNPDILRFFRYMKAAKDGQDGEECVAHGGCSSLSTNNPSPAMLTTFNDINKLVLARKLQ